MKTTNTQSAAYVCASLPAWRDFAAQAIAKGQSEAEFLAECHPDNWHNARTAFRMNRAAAARVARPPQWEALPPYLTPADPVTGRQVERNLHPIAYGTEGAPDANGFRTGRPILVEVTGSRELAAAVAKALNAGRVKP
jgi:hypothetical protein